MKSSVRKLALDAAVAAARDAGELMRRHWRSPKKISAETQHDIKLELDVRCQERIQRRLLSALPESAVLGEEGGAGAAGSALRWVVDPIDGTVNYTHGIPHACVSIALQAAPGGGPARREDADFVTWVGVVYDPFCEELWTAVRGEPARLNGRVTRVSARHRLEEGMIVVGFGKSAAALNHMLSLLGALTHRVRKVRIMGSAALALTYVASGRFDAYLEAGVRLWDFAAGALMVECAGGRFECQKLAGDQVYALNANNRRLHRVLARFGGPAVSS